MTKLGSKCCALGGPDLFSVQCSDLGFLLCSFQLSHGNTKLEFQRGTNRGTVLRPELGFNDVPSVTPTCSTSSAPTFFSFCAPSSDPTATPSCNPSAGPTAGKTAGPSFCPSLVPRAFS